MNIYILEYHTDTNRYEHLPVLVLLVIFKSIQIKPSAEMIWFDSFTLTVASLYSAGMGECAISQSLSSQYVFMLNAECIHRGQR